MHRKLDSLRGLIAMAIVLYHSQFFAVPGGIEIMHNAYLCVDMLFMLSGFVLSAAYADRIRAGFDFRRLLILRLGRLYPLHAVMMLVWLVYVLAKQALYDHGFGGNDPLRNNDLPSFFGSLLLLHSMGFFDHVNWNVPSWSIGALMLSYIVFFLFCRFVARPLFLKALLIALFGYGFIGFVLRKTDFDITYDYGFARCLAGFFTGVFCHGIKQQSQFHELSSRQIMPLEILAFAALLMVLQYAEHSAIILYGALPLLAAIILLLSSRRSGVIGKILEAAPLQAVGKLAFSIYLTHYIIVLTAANIFQYALHWPLQPVREQYGTMVMGFVGEWTLGVNAALLVIVVAVSLFTYRFIEMPCRQWSRAWVDKNPLPPDLLGAKVK